jgi:hypothetical protein
MKVDIFKATEEVNEWLDYKKVGAKKRELQRESIETLVEAICEGHLTKSEDHEFEYSLLFPIETEDNKIEKLKFKPRVHTSDISTQLTKVKPGDVHGMICGYAAALTGKPRAVIAALDTEDFGVVGAIAVFFM